MHSTHIAEPDNLIGRYAAFWNAIEPYAGPFIAFLCAFTGAIAIVSYVLSLMP